VTTLAHISDLHLDGTRPPRERLSRALENAWSRKPDHLIVTGDVTAGGSRRHIAELRAALVGWPTPVTVVPGNHDGSLVGFTSAITDFGDALLVPVDTRANYKPWAFSALGRVGFAQLAVIDRLTARSDRPVVLAMHHGPQYHPLHVFDGLVDGLRVRTLLRDRPWVHIVCGHDHRCLDVGRVHVAPSVAHHPDPVRIYQIAGRDVRPVYRSEYTGAYFT
jgi:3',5'-cyclic AMP phosphodiesterase CpdA